MGPYLHTVGAQPCKKKQLVFFWGSIVNTLQIYFILAYAEDVWENFQGNRELPLPIGSMYGIFSYIWLFLMMKYGKCIGEYTSPMEPMG